MVKCDCECDQLFYRKKPRNGLEPIFLSPKHEGRYYQNLRLAEACGEFKNLVDEYLWGFASYHYRNLSYPRSALRLFFHFLNRQGVKLLEEVTTSTITQYLIWARKSKSRVGPSDVSAITVFFDWLIAEGRRTAANPVVSKIHQPRTKNRLPRPLGPQELEFAWRLLNERGNPRLRFAAAAAEEAGLRIGEICNLRLQDVDPLRQRFFVRLPNKTNQERWAFFGEKTKRLYIEWMAVRGQNCGHDFVIHSLHGRPMRAGTLGPEFRRILCKTFDGEQVNEIGFDSWSTHRLRHNMASNLVSGGADAATVMASGGWRSCQAMTRYVRVDTRVVRHDYAHAMQRFRETKQSSVEKKVLTPAELLDRFAQPDHLFDEGALQAWVANAE
jgi:site-specific recombinase XerD